MSTRVAQYKFSNANEAAGRMGWAHVTFLFFLLLWIPMLGWMVEGRTVICFISGLIMILLHRLLDMKRPQNVGMLILTYLMLVGAELLMLGVPQQLIEIDPNLSKGILLELILYILPMVYVGVRVLFILPLFSLLTWSRRLSHLELS